MYESQDGSSEDGHSTATDVMDKARDQVSTIRDQAGERMEQGRDRIEEGREKAAEGAHTAAERVREEAEHRGGMQGKMGIKAADTMEQAAGYLREHKTDEIWSDMERYAKDHPMQAVGGAVFAGFVLGRILR
jgi:ElaB/YqjD/DUF883 family membrane-anchored ribosome-binding protein